MDRTAPCPEAEVDTARQQFGIGDMPCQHALYGDHLEILAAPLHEQGRLAVVHRQFRDARRFRTEPEDEVTPALPHLFKIDGASGAVFIYGNCSQTPKG